MSVPAFRTTSCWRACPPRAVACPEGAKIAFELHKQPVAATTVQIFLHPSVQHEHRTLKGSSYLPHRLPRSDRMLWVASGPVPSLHRQFVLAELRKSRLDVYIV